MRYDRDMSTKPAVTEERSVEDAAKWARFDAEVQKGLDSAQAGDLMDADEFFDQLDAELAALPNQPK